MIIEITEDEITAQNINYDSDYLVGVVAGDMVFDDGEVLVGKACIESWQATSSSVQEHDKYSIILQKLG